MTLHLTSKLSLFSNTVGVYVSMMNKLCVRTDTYVHMPGGVVKR